MTAVVTDANGNPTPLGTLVTWSIQSGGGQLSLATDTLFSTNAVTSQTDSFGSTSVQWMLGTVAGGDSLTASGNGASIVFSATAQPGAVAALLPVAGNGQEVPDGSASAPFTVQAVDQYGNAVPGVTIDWVDQSGGVLSTTSSVTDANGLASVVLTTAQTTANYTIVAELSTTSNVAVQFTAASP